MHIQSKRIFRVGQIDIYRVAPQQTLQRHAKHALLSFAHRESVDISLDLYTVLHSYHQNSTELSGDYFRRLWRYFRYNSVGQHLLLKFAVIYHVYVAGKVNTHLSLATFPRTSEIKLTCPPYQSAVLSLPNVRSVIWTPMPALPGEVQKINCNPSLRHRRLESIIKFILVSPRIWTVRQRLFSAANYYSVRW